MTVDFLSEAMEVRVTQYLFFKCWKKIAINPESYIQQKYPLGREFVACGPTLNEWLKDVLQTERNQFKKWILKHQEKKKDTVNKNMGKCNRLSFSSCVF